MISRAVAPHAVSPLIAHRHCRRLCRAHSSQAVHQLLDDTAWLLPSPAVEVMAVRHGAAAFAVIRDDQLHPFLGGNKLRKLDGLWASLAPAADVITCGGLQSAHTVAVAAACAQHGKRCHLLVRGERPAVPTGHHLYARLFAHHVEYVSRAQYADREAMIAGYLQRLQQEQQEQAQQAPTSIAAAAVGAWRGDVPAAVAAAAEASAAVLEAEAAASRSTSTGSSSGRIAVLPEGGASAGALLGLIRLGAWLAEHPQLADRRCNIVVDSGTGATATGLALGAALLGLPWRVTGVMLAAPLEYYLSQQRSLTAAFCAEHGMDAAAAQQGTAGRLAWVQRPAPRQFGKVLAGEVAACRAVAQQHGIVLDPIWSLAAWEVCRLVAEAAPESGSGSVADSSSDGGRNSTSSSGAWGGTAGRQGGELAVMLHTGGMLGLCGLAQRRPHEF